MKFAIMTWFRNMNYGTVLQAYSLRKFLVENYMANVDLIMYANNMDDTIREPIRSGNILIRKIKNNIKRRWNNYWYRILGECRYEKQIQEKINKFNAFISTNITFTVPVQTNEDFEKILEEYDLFICGSDQIWNPMLLNGKYYLDFVKNKPKIAYAPSIAMDNIPPFAKPYIKKFLSDFCAVGVREESGSVAIQELTNLNVRNVCDPTLLLYDFWRETVKEKPAKEKYCLTYFLGSRSYYKRVINDVLKQFNLTQYTIPINLFGYKSGGKIIAEAGIEDFLSLIRNASFVCVDSFHAVIFSVIFEKQFCVLNKYPSRAVDSQNSRIRDFLKKIGLEDRIIDEECKVIDLPYIDYTTVRSKLNVFIEESKQFLKETIEFLQNQR